MAVLKYHLLLLLAVIAWSTITAQIEDELQIPVENDNQFPPENETETIEGSGAGIVEDPAIVTTSEKITDTTVQPILEDMESTGPPERTTVNNQACPDQCQCSVEDKDFVVNCAGSDITQFPISIDVGTTKLYLQNNKLTEIPKDVSILKNLVVLNANNNSIASIESGSISELSKLLVLKLANNRLIEYPNDLKNSFGLTALKELDLGGNDMRTPLTPEMFTSFNSLEKLTLPTSTSELLENFCKALEDSLETVCTGSCTEQSYECLDTPQKLEDDLFDATLPAMIAYSNILADNVDAPGNLDKDNKKDITEQKQENQLLNNVDINKIPVPVQSRTAVVNDNTATVNEPVNDFSLRSAVDEAPVENIQSNKADFQKPATDSNVTDIKIGATTQSKTEGVDKSVIGIIVAGMVVIVAGITIKKNWNSIKNRFSSSPRPANERVTGSANNGTTPEEVPLQDKSPA